MRIDFEKLDGIARENYQFKTSHLSIPAKHIGLYPLSYPVIQIVGSKGKGTLGFCLSHALRAMNIKAGFFNSPDLGNPYQRFFLPLARKSEIRASMATFQRVFAEVLEPVSEFEKQTLFAYWLFQHEKCNVGIFEAGLGGEKDATSIVQAHAVVLTSVELEHRQQLGDTISEIVHAKLGMLTKQSILFTGRLTKEAKDLVASITDKVGCCWQPLDEKIALKNQQFSRQGSYFLSEDPFEKSWKPFSTAAYGEHIPFNIAACNFILSYLIKVGIIPPKPLPAPKAWQTLDLPGRLQLVSDERNIMFDPAHTFESVRLCLTSLQLHIGRSPDVIIAGFAEDKDIQKILSELNPTGAVCIFLPLPSSRSWKPSTHKALFPNGSLIVEDMKEAWSLVQNMSKKQDLVLVLGSFQLHSSFSSLLAIQ